MPQVTAETIIDFWFEQSSPKDWFAKSEAFDSKIVSQFAKTYDAAINGELYDWRSTPAGRLAEVIVLDQFSRNMFRKSPQAFRFDSLAVVLSQQAIDLGDDLKLPLQKRKFLYMPFMHSESLVIHNMAVNVFSQSGLEDNLEYEIKHRQIIERFGRYPHRNSVLDRQSTQEEVEFLKQPGSSF